MKTVDPENEHRPFGGKLMVFGGDFRQIPPVIKQGRREETIAASFKRSPLWQHIQNLHLAVNMRLLRNANAPDMKEQTEFANCLLQRAVLCPTNENVDEVNDRINQASFSLKNPIIDKDDDRVDALFPVDFLNGLKSSSLPPYRLRLAVGCPIILLRNLMPMVRVCP